MVGGAERVVERRDGGLLAVGGRDRRQGGAVVIGQLLCAGEERRREAIWRVVCFARCNKFAEQKRNGSPCDSQSNQS